jgi:hypothetical protein
MSELSADRAGRRRVAGHEERLPCGASAPEQGPAAPPGRASTQRSGVALHGYEQSAPRFCLSTNRAGSLTPELSLAFTSKQGSRIGRSETSFSPEAGCWSGRRPGFVPSERLGSRRSRYSFHGGAILGGVCRRGRAMGRSRLRRPRALRPGGRRSPRSARGGLRSSAVARGRPAARLAPRPRRRTRR